MKASIFSLSIFSFLVLAALSFSSCQREDDRVEVPVRQLSLSASIGGATKASATPKTAWATGDSLGVFVLSDAGGFSSPYHGLSANLNSPFSYGAGGWTSAKITLDSNRGDVYAYYPYAATSADGSAIPVESLTQTDYLWSKGEAKVSVYDTHVNLRMQHALSQVVFRMRRENYTGGEGRFTGLTIENNGASNALQTSGTLNLATGGITGTASGRVELAANHLIEAEESLFAAIVLPVMATAGEEVKVIFTIDGKEYYHIFAAGTAWTPGYRNIYSFILKDNHLVIGGGDAEGGAGGPVIEPWTDSDKGFILLIPTV